MKTTKTIEQQRGTTLVELSWAMVLGVLVAGTLFASQRTSIESFNGSILEHKATGTLRGGLKEVRKEIRSARPDSITVGSPSTFLGSGSSPFLEFQTPVEFDYATGSVTWGGDEQVDATVGYYVEGDEIARYILISGVRSDATRTVLVDDLVDDGAQVPVAVTWIENKNLLALTLQVAAPGGSSANARNISTMIRVEPIFDF
ncbi:MAG: hypothetical protein V3W41_09710 [Planctomycetota bacterium]